MPFDPNFVDDPDAETLLPIKTVKKPVPAGQDVSKYDRAEDFNQQRQAMLDLRTRAIEHGLSIEELVAEVIALGLRVTALEAAAGASAGGVNIGDGSDGSPHFDGVTNVPGTTLAGGVYTQTRSLYLQTPTFDANVRLHANGWYFLVKGELIGPSTGAAYVSCNGGNATTGGIGGVAAMPVGTAGPLRNGISIAGANGSANWASAPGNGSGTAYSPRGFTAGNAAAGARAANTNQPGNPGANGAPGQGGGGGSGGGNGAGSYPLAGAVGGTVTLKGDANGDIRDGNNAINGVPPRDVLGWTIGSSGGGGVGGLGRADNPGGGVNASDYGGGSGAPGGYLVLLARKITGNFVFQANGGNGGAASAIYSGGGGGGGAGGLCVVGIGDGVFPSEGSTNFAMQANGGTGGAPGVGVTSGGAGGNGGAGLVFEKRL